MFQGRLRLPGSTPAEKIKKRVGEILKLLEIAHVASVPIGDEVNLFLLIYSSSIIHIVSQASNE